MLEFAVCGRLLPALCLLTEHKPLSSIDIQASISDELVAFANKLAENNPDADPWEIADGLLSGAVHWWLYANAPCADPACEDCAPIRTAELRMKTLQIIK